MLHLDVFDEDGQLVRANVFVDEGSNGTLFREEFIRHLRLSGVSQMLTVEGAGAIKKVYSSRYIAVRIRLPSGEIVELDGSTMPTVVSPVPAVDWKKLKSKWKHLADLPTESSGGRVDILLGSDVVHLTTASESRIGQDYEPTASLTRIGWIVRGTIGDKDPSRAIQSHAIFAEGEDVDKLAQQLKKFCDTEDFGTERAWRFGNGQIGGKDFGEQHPKIRGRLRSSDLVENGGAINYDFLIDLIEIRTTNPMNGGPGC